MKRAVITGIWPGRRLSGAASAGQGLQGLRNLPKNKLLQRLAAGGGSAFADHPDLTLSVSDVTDPGSCIRILETAQPHEVYNLAAQSFVAASFDQPTLTTQIDGLGALNLLEAIRTVDRSIRFYQASSAEMFGLVQTIPQSEDTPFYPRSPYAVAKLCAHWMAINYREAHGIFASCGIMFNHEFAASWHRVRHPEDHRCGRADCLRRRNWCWSLATWTHCGTGDLPTNMSRACGARFRRASPDTFVFATGRSESVRAFATMAFKGAGIDIAWQGSGVDETAIRLSDRRVVVRVSPQFYRPSEVEALIGDPSKAGRLLGWQPRTELSELCAMMVDADLRRRRAADRPLHAFAA